MKKRYKTELEGQGDFYEELGFVGDKTPDYSCNTDGRIGGTLVEFKRIKKNLPQTQLKDYIKSYNSSAKLIPRYSLFISINHKEFTFVDNSKWKIIDSGNWKNPKDLLKFLDKKNKYIKGWIDEYSIVAYNDKFFNEFLYGAKKDDFIEEIRNPKVLNIKPYQWNKTGKLATDLSDSLGADALKKRLGAFFTPDIKIIEKKIEKIKKKINFKITPRGYVEISTEYLRDAIKRVPKGYDYIILDRCAGTGNLQKFLTKEELSHCILNTYVYVEWTTLKGLYGGRARCIIPHTKKKKDGLGLLRDGDALTEDFHKIITKMIEKERKKAGNKLIVIGLENPPFTEPQAEASRGGKTHKQTSWVKKQMNNNKCGAASNDLANQFIWSMKKYADEYIVFAPIKYWKSQHLFDGKFNEGYLCNREYFNAAPNSKLAKAGISLISWTIGKKENNCLNMESDLGDRKIKKIKVGISQVKIPQSNGKMICGIHSYSGTPDFKHGELANIIKPSWHSKLNWLDKTTLLQALPLWVANCYRPKDYTEKEVIMKSGDGGTKYLRSKNFLNDCFVYSCLTNSNKCISNKQIKNEMCLMQDTEADKLFDINKRNEMLLQKWQEVLKIAKTKKEYNLKFTYGLHQVCRDINIQIEIGTNKKNEPETEPKYSDLNDVIKEFKEQLKEYYDKHITPKLLKYELIK